MSGSRVIPDEEIGRLKKAEELGKRGLARKINSLLWNFIPVRIQNISFTDTTLVEGVLCGLFSFLFNKDLTRKNITVTKKGTYMDVTIK